MYGRTVIRYGAAVNLVFCGVDAQIGDVVSGNSGGVKRAVLNVGFVKLLAIVFGQTAHNVGRDSCIQCVVVTPHHVHIPGFIIARCLFHFLILLFLP